MTPNVHIENNDYYYSFGTRADGEKVSNCRHLLEGQDVCRLIKKVCPKVGKIACGNKCAYVTSIENKQTDLLTLELGRFAQCKQKSRSIGTHICSLPCGCFRDTTLPTNSQEGTTWHLDKQGKNIIHRECGGSVGRIS